MAAAEDDTPDDITSLAEYRRSDRRAAFIRNVDGYQVQGIPQSTKAGGVMAVFVYQPGVMGPVYDATFEMDDTTRENYGLTEGVQREFNDILNQAFNWPPAMA